MADIRIDARELNDPAVEEVVNLQKSLARSSGQFIEDIPTPFYLNPIFYYSAATLVAGILAWLACEPFIREKPEDVHEGFVAGILVTYLFFGLVAVLIGVSVSVAYGLSNRNLQQMLYVGVVTVGVCFVAALVTSTAGAILYWIGRVGVIMAVMSSGERPAPGEGLHGLPFFLQMCARAIAWAAVATGSGLGLGIALKSKKLVLNGLAGGLIGGMLGGLLFDPVDRFVMGWSDVAWVSRLVGVGSIGLLVGLFTGLFENMSKDAWFLMLKGPLTGKQFIVFKSPLVIGSAPKSDIYLFKDPAIEPRHATVTKSGAKYILQDTGTPAGTFVNGRKIDRCILQPDDVVSIGETVLKYHERVKR
jgi:hypothetical protein